MNGRGLLDKSGCVLLVDTLHYDLYYLLDVHGVTRWRYWKKVSLISLDQGNLINFDANRYEFGPVYGLLGITISNLPPMQGNNQTTVSSLTRNL